MARRKKQPSQSVLKVKQPHKKWTGLLIAITITMILGGIPFGLGKYIELNSPGPYDSGSYVYSAKHLLTGARLGIEEQPSAGAGTLIANIIGVKLFGFNDRGPKIVQMILQLAAGIFMFYTLRRVFGSVAAVVGTALAGFCLSAPLIAKFGNVKEQFMIAFMVYAACCFILFEFTQKRYWVVLTGFFAVMPYYFKATGVSIVIAIVLYLLLKNLFSKKWNALCFEMLLFLCGYAAGLILPGGLFLWQKKTELLAKTFPVTALQLGVVFVVFLLIVFYGWNYLGKVVRFSDFKKVSKSIWAAGLVSIFLAFALSIFIVRHTRGFIPGDVDSYVHSIPLVSVPEGLINHATIRISHAVGLDSGYLSGAWAAIGFADVTKKIGRYYMALKLPISLALTSMIIAVIVWSKTLFKKTIPQDIQSKIIWLLALWWLLDTALVWVSPRSYEQYYLPLCASAAMLSGYGVWLWQQKFLTAQNKWPLLAIAAVASIVMLSFSWNLCAGRPKSPDTGAQYTNTSGQPDRARGFAQALERVKEGRQQPWQTIGDYIRSHSRDTDEIYVWGWVPGIYVEAQRMAPVPKAFESDMHVTPPARLQAEIASLVENMRQHPPKFIVDTRKRHVPWNRLPLELWPTAPAKAFGNKFARPLKNDEREIIAYDTGYMDFLEKSVNKDEALRYQAMKPFRDFVMTYYKPVVRREFGIHGLYERIEQTEPQTP